jgi:hypothetical protein
MMTNRRKSHFDRRRTHHMAMRITKVMRQEWQSSIEGPNDSPKAQKAQTALKSRKA